MSREADGDGCRALSARGVGLTPLYVPIVAHECRLVNHFPSHQSKLVAYIM
jgi:hypothetical protein